MDVRVELECETAAEVYSVPSLKDQGPRRLAIFFHPESANEIEVYAESVEDASNLFALLSSALRGHRRSESQLAVEARSDSCAE
jgi:hypothetical protein